MDRNNDSFRTEKFRQLKAEQSRKNFLEGKTGLTDNKGENNGMFGKSQSKEARQKMREAKIGKFDGDKNPMFGQNHSDSTKDKISQARKGKIWINNGLVSKSVLPDEFETLRNDGWVRGRTMDSRASRNYILKNFT